MLIKIGLGCYIVASSPSSSFYVVCFPSAIF